MQAFFIVPLLKMDLNRWAAHTKKIPKAHGIEGFFAREKDNLAVPHFMKGLIRFFFS